ncbi:MAG: type I DNA topoisomerase [Rikenellaceae bacterium]|nr:type I DNA topoisomerase [Rikenellaceae bacterium]
MQENLVIVESPAKAKTIEKFLGKDYVVKSSFGHIRDLAKKDLGIDIDNDFAPVYEVAPDKKKVVSELSKLAKGAKAVWLASDEDREGEAIAWHLTQVLGLDVASTRRIVFHEITRNAILHAVENPRTVNMDLVNAQQARRVLDRLVGFELSPVLWKKVKPSLSAGRVQSVAVRLIVEREREIIGFKPAEYFRVTGQFHAPGSKAAFRAELNKRFKTEAEMSAFLEKCRDAAYTVTRIEQKPARKSPPAPFTTSTLQQEAGRKFGMSVAQIMSVAQKLYEAGWITYMRTDSVNLSGQAIAAAKAEITSRFGEQYSEVRNYKTKSKGAQEAHEAIRPAYMNQATIEGTPQEKRLYELIWKRTLASQMAAARTEKTTIDIAVSGAQELFVASGEVIKFDGFLKLYSESVEDDHSESEEAVLPPVKQGDALAADAITATQRFTQSPPRYSEASLVKTLEELGIGRPSTYAPTISTIISRGYVIKESREGAPRGYRQWTLAGGKVTDKELTETVGKEKNKLLPTDIGMVVNDYLEQQFQDILDYNFTAKVEKEFDEIAEGKKSWVEMLHGFYSDFHKTVETALSTAPERSHQVRHLGVDPVSGKEIIARIGKFGPMVQKGGTTEGDKPVYASLKKGQLIASLTLEEALELFALPRSLGEYEGKEVVIGIGRFGPYARHDGKFYSLAKTDDPYTITLDRATELIVQKKAQQEAMKTPIHSFADGEIQVLNGRYGPYIASGGKNYRIPKGTDPASLTEEQCREIMAKSKK